MNEVILVSQVQAGDEAAFDTLYHLYIGQAVKVAFLITRSQQAAEDAAQEAFVQVLRRIHTLREPRNFRSWFYSILHNAARRSGRKGRGWTFFPFDLLSRGEPDPQAAAVEEVVLGKQEQEELRRLIAELPDLYRDVIVLRYYADLSEPEIADALGIPVGTVKSRLHGARQRLVTLLRAPESAKDRGITHAAR
ncbi:MAG TPA: RNA polymerase sigma factor [Symbiobacteriaceae bacterium]|nr:RNA polymerase sigma factor [Symbiobacteriaceae bacterium]